MYKDSLGQFPRDDRVTFSQALVEILWKAAIVSARKCSLRGNSAICTFSGQQFCVVHAGNRHKPRRIPRTPRRVATPALTEDRPLGRMVQDMQPNQPGVQIPIVCRHESR